MRDLNRVGVVNEDAATSIWRRRISSCPRILNFGFVQNLLPEVWTQLLGFSQIDFAPGEEFKQ